MMKEHYELIVDHFKLEKKNLTYGFVNGGYVYIDATYPFYVKYCTSEAYEIWVTESHDDNHAVRIMCNIQSEELANEIIQYIKDTAILFL